MCFGYKDSTQKYEDGWCPESNLYRIIGVFREDETSPYKVKLIKSTFAGENELGTFSVTVNGFLYSSERKYGSPSEKYSGTKNLNLPSESYYWNNINASIAENAYGHKNIWSYSMLNTKHLNDYFLNNYLKGDKDIWKTMIDDTTWYVYGVTKAMLNENNKELYNYEVGRQKKVTAPFEPYRAKVGLMYISDYAYATSPSWWNNTMSLYVENLNSNWLYTGYGEWTISRIHNEAAGYNVKRDIVVISYDSGVVAMTACDIVSRTVRPTFYLNTDVEYVGGTGSPSDPYRINFSVN